MGHARVTTFAYLGTAARLYLKLAQESEDSQFYHCMTAILYSALTAEAFLNHLGEDQFSNWAQTHERKKPCEKLRLLAKKVGLQLDFGREPCQSFIRAFKFRNFVAHGKTTALDWPSVPRSANLAFMPEALWERAATTKNTKRILDNIQKLIRALSRAAGDTTDPFIVHKTGIRWGPAPE